MAWANDDLKSETPESPPPVPKILGAVTLDQENIKEMVARFAPSSNIPNSEKTFADSFKNVDDSSLGLFIPFDEKLAPSLEQREVLAKAVVDFLDKRGIKTNNEAPFYESAADLQASGDGDIPNEGSFFMRIDLSQKAKGFKELLQTALTELSAAALQVAESGVSPAKPK